MSDYINLQSRCQRGEASLSGANNLLAECHAALGQLIAENDAVRAAYMAAGEREHALRQFIQGFAEYDAEMAFAYAALGNGEQS